MPIAMPIAKSIEIDPRDVLTQTEPLAPAIEAYETFDNRKAGWVKVELLPVVA